MSASVIDDWTRKSEVEVQSGDKEEFAFEKPMKDDDEESQ